jgi:hypothetical protein
MLRDLEPEDAETERMIRNSFRWQWLTFALLLSTMAVVFALPQVHIPKAIIWLLMATVVITAFYTGRKVRDAKVAVTSRYYLDTQHRRWRIGLMIMLIFGLIGVHHLTHIPDSHDPFELGIGLLALFAPFTSLIMGPKAEIDDESIRAIRSRAMRVGYVCAVLVLAAVTAVAVYRPAAVMTALAWGLFAASAVPIVLYVVLDWWSDRGADG